MLVLEYMLLQKKLAKLNIDTPYKTLKIKEQMRQLVTSIENKKQAITIYLESLEGNPKEEKAAPDITVADLITDNGMGNYLLNLTGSFGVKPSLKLITSIQNLYCLKKNRWNDCSYFRIQTSLPNNDAAK